VVLQLISNDVVGAPVHHTELWSRLPPAAPQLTEQPLQDVRNYYGEQIALYFAFIGVYTQSLFWPAIAGIVVFIFRLQYGVDKNPLAMPYGVFMMLWSVHFISQWHRRESELKFMWGTELFEETEKPRRPA
jgi:hypothetical protein